MKQRVTFEDLSELTEEQKAKIKKWWEPELGDMFTEFVDVAGLRGSNDFVISDLESFVDSAERKNKNLVPLLSIGQMIDYLNTNDIRPDRAESNQWWIDRWHKRDLCNQLWEMVKLIQ
jgi:hypothetical protein